MNIKDLFLDVKGEQIVFKKLITKDGWGSDYFLIKGDVPEELKKLKVTTKKLYEKQMKESFEQSVQRYIATAEYDYAIVTNMCTMINDNLVDLIRLKPLTKSRIDAQYINKYIYEYIMKQFKGVGWKIAKEGYPVIAIKDKKPVAIVGVIEVSADAKKSIITPTEKMKLLLAKKDKEGRKDGNSIDRDKQENRGSNNEEQ